MIPHHSTAIMKLNDTGWRSQSTFPSLTGIAIPPIMTFYIGDWIIHHYQHILVLFVEKCNLLCSTFNSISQSKNRLQIFEPEAVELYASRGYITPSSKLFMRTSVVLSDIIIYFPAVIFFVFTFYNEVEYRKKVRLFQSNNIMENCNNILN